MRRRERIRERIVSLEQLGVIRDWYVQGDMPGLRWTIIGHGWDRTYTTAEVEVFFDGVAIGRQPS